MPPAQTLTRGAGGLFECRFAGCGKPFTRKEHLNRHMRTHQPQLAHQCPICGRRYARSDVLKRHIDFHPPPTSRRDFVACTGCQTRKLKCDEATPCQSCARSSTYCDRPGPRGQSGGSQPEATALLSGDGALLADPSHFLPAEEPAVADVMQPTWTGMPQQQWPAPAQDHDWSLPAFSPSAFTQLTNAADSHLNGPGSWLPDGNDPEMANHLAPESSTAQLRPLSLPTEQHQSEHSTTHTWDHTPNFAASAGPYPLPTPGPSSLCSQTSSILDKLPHRDPLRTEKLLHIFFEEIHPLWPILHAPSFDKSSVADVLLASMAMLASKVDGGQEHEFLAGGVFEAIAAATQPETAPSLHTLQALFLCVVYAISGRNNTGMLVRAIRLNGILVSACRCLDIFNGHYALPERIMDCAFTSWLATEQLHRLAFAVLRVDAYLSILLDHPPSVRYQELCIPLPKSPRLWAAVSDAERRKLQWDEPAGRERVLFSTLMRDALDVHHDGQAGLPLPYRLTETDYHVGLCALLTGTWEAAKEAHSSASDNLVTKLHPGGPIQLWRAHLRRWRAGMEKDLSLCPDAADGGGEDATACKEDAVLRPLTLLIWHIANLRMHCPLDLLNQVRGSGGRPQLFGTTAGDATSSGVPPSPPPSSFSSASFAGQKTRTRLRSWMASECPRTSLWSAAQIARIATAYKTKDDGPCGRACVLDPFAVPGLCMAAVVCCAFASATQACPECVGGPAGVVGTASAAVDLFAAISGEEEEGDSALRAWARSGDGCAVWGGAATGAGIPVCRCRLPELGAWFREALAEDEGALGKVEGFLDGLVAR